MSMYDWTHHYGGILLTRDLDGAEVFLQPGDDANGFLKEVACTNEKYTDDDLISEYFVDVPLNGPTDGMTLSKWAREDAL